MTDNQATRESPDQSKADQVKQQGQHVAEQARTEAGAVADKVRDEAGSVAQVAQEQVRGLFGDAQDRVQQEAEQQVERLAGALNSLSKSLEALREGRPDDAGPLVDYLERVQNQIERFGSRVEDMGLSGVLDESRRFARRRPGVFLGTAAFAGLVVGRLARGGRDAQQADQESRRGLPAETGDRPMPTSPSPAQTTGVGDPVGRAAGTASTPGTGASGTVSTPGAGRSTPGAGTSGPGENDLGARPVDQYGTVRGGVESER